MARLFVALTPLLQIASGFQLQGMSPTRSHVASVSMFEEGSAKPEFELRPAITKSGSVTPREGPSVIVTEGNDKFYENRNMIQMLHDFGAHSAISVYGESADAAKKALLSRQARYSGLLDVLDTREGALAEAMSSADFWLAMSADESAIPEQIAAAKQAGIKRAFIVICADGPSAALSDSEAVEKMLAESGLRYTLMRTGSLVEAADSGGGLRIGEVDIPVCEDVSKEDVFRFVTEALTLPESEGRLFSLCPSEDSSQLRQMRLAGYGRREEVQALLKGYISDQTAEAEVAPEPELVMRSEAEVEAERAEELRGLLERARARGEATQKKLKFEEEERAKEREEQQRYYSKPPSDDGAAPPADEE